MQYTVKSTKKILYSVIQSSKNISQFFQTDFKRIGLWGKWIVRRYYDYFFLSLLTKQTPYLNSTFRLEVAVFKNIYICFKVVRCTMGKILWDTGTTDWISFVFGVCVGGGLHNLNCLKRNISIVSCSVTLITTIIQGKFKIYTQSKFFTCVKFRFQIIASIPKNNKDYLCRDLPLLHVKTPSS